MTGTIQSFELTFGTFGHQYTTIDGQVYLTWFDLRNPMLQGLGVGATVEFDTRPVPTVLCHSPRVEDKLPSAILLRVVRREEHGVTL